MAHSAEIPIAAVYIFLIVAFFVSRTIFWATLAVILLVYFIRPEMLGCVGATVFTNLTYVAFAIILVMLIVGIIMLVVLKDKAYSYGSKWSSGWMAKA